MGSHSIAAIDVGTTKVCTIVADVDPPPFTCTTPAKLSWLLWLITT